MTFQSILWTTNGTGDGLSGGYTQALLVDWMRRTMLGDGATEVVLINWLGELAVTNPSGKTMRIASGAGYADGFPFDNNANVDLTPSTPVGANREDRIIVRVDWTAQTVRGVIKEGAEGAGVPPTLTQVSGTTWEVSLATYTIDTGDNITGLTDEREFVHFNTKVDSSMMDVDSVLAAAIAAGAVGSSELAANAVIAGKIAAGAISQSSDFAAGVVDAAAIGAGAVGSSELAANAVIAGKIASGAINQSSDFAAGVVDAAAIGAGAVGSSEIATGAVGSSEIAAGAVDTSELAADSVDDTKAGNRVPQFYRRQGNSASDWTTAGSNNYTPGAVRMQGGAVISGSSPINVFYPVPFSFPPLLFVNCESLSTTQPYFAVASVVGSSTFACAVFDYQGNYVTGQPIHWLAIGPE